MGDTTVMRFREYTVRAVTDPQAVPVFTAVCVTGEDADCGAVSGDMHDPDNLVHWIAGHFRDTGHAQFERSTRATVVAEAGPWV
jgi:hypothetical protein